MASLVYGSTPDKIRANVGTRSSWTRLYPPVVTIAFVIGLRHPSGH
jgi:hypothetical protein